MMVNNRLMKNSMLNVLKGTPSVFLQFEGYFSDLQNQQAESGKEIVFAERAKEKEIKNVKAIEQSISYNCNWSFSN
ncbi:MAG: hypothetical protein WBD58_11135 [Geitlerinemataceae cyanobacterium]